VSDQSLLSTMLLLVSSLAVSVLSVVSAVDVPAKFSADEVVPDVVSAAPGDQLQVVYDEGTAELGNNLQVSKTSSQPTVAYTGAESDQLYTVAMVDPDAPSRDNPRAAQWNHWLVTNVEGSDLQEGGEINGKVLMKYNGPSPPKGSGMH